ASGRPASRRRRRPRPPRPRPHPRPPRPTPPPTPRRAPPMADIAAKDVAALRKATGAALMCCKSALEENAGDLAAAMDWLRAEGLGKAGKLGEREATEGAVDARVVGDVGVLVELNCNTDFVAKGADFTQTLAGLAELAVAHDGDLTGLAFNGSTVADTLA